LGGFACQKQLSTVFDGATRVGSFSERKESSNPSRQKKNEGHPNGYPSFLAEKERFETSKTIENSMVLKRFDYILTT